jgi:excinuclease ABC subunit C
MFRITDAPASVFDAFGPSVFLHQPLLEDLSLLCPVGGMVEKSRDSGGGGRGRGGRRRAIDAAAWGGREPAIRKLVRDHCPQQPGVYGMIDAEGRLIYVGKSKSLRDRLVSYFVGKGLASKARRVVSHARRLVWECLPHEFTALLRELELIRRWCPRFNVRARPGRVRRAYLAIGGGPAARARLVAGASPEDRLVVGPMPRGRPASHLVRTLNDAFQLCDCPNRRSMAFSDQGELFARQREAGCLRHSLRNCLGPCAGACSSRQYADRVRQARDFLTGGDLSILGRLEGAMRAAAAAAQFERAAALRDAWRELGALREWLERLKGVRRTYAFVYPVPNQEQGETWYFVQRGQVVAALEAPRNRTTARACLRRLDAIYPQGAGGPAEAAADDPDMVLLVSIWFRARPDELARTLAPPAARARCLELSGGDAGEKRRGSP